MTLPGQSNTPIERAKRQCVCGHPRVAHNAVGGACKWETCSCERFVDYLTGKTDVPFRERQ